MSQETDIRTHLIEELKRDLVGPREEEEEFWELNGDKPTSRYISGVLYPKQTKLDADTQLTDTVQGENEDEEEEPINQDTSPFAIATGTQPSSLGITCCVPIDTKLIDVEVNFAKYDKQERKMEPKKNKKTKTDENEEKVDESLDDIIYPKIEKTFLNIVNDSGFPGVKVDKKIDFEKLYSEKFK